MTKLHNQKNLKERRKDLRNDMPPAEVILWTQLKNKKLHGYKFRRQHSLANYIVDFYCPKLKLVIEIDGHTHRIDQDKIRDQILEGKKISVLRFTNNNIYKNLDGVIRTIEAQMPLV